jgi:hypothetical protein
VHDHECGVLGGEFGLHGLPAAVALTRHGAVRVGIKLPVELGGEADGFHDAKAGYDK